MKVLHVIPSIAPRDGGPSTVVLKMASELLDAGLEVAIATTDADGSIRLPVPLGSMAEYEGVPTIFFHREFSVAFKYSGRLAAWLGRHVAEFDAVHVHGVFSHSCLAAARACRSASVPYVVRPLGALERWSLRQKPVRKRVALALGTRRMLAIAAAVHYTTERERRESEQMLGLSNGIVIPLGVELARDPHPRPSATPSPQVVERGTRGEDAVTILFLSRLHPKKGVEILLEAFARIVLDEARSSGGDRTRLVIAGSGDPAYEQSLRRLAESLGIAERVSFPGWLDREAKAAAFAEADLFVLPSAQENFGLSVLEAMAAGVPVAVSRGVDLSDDVELAGAGWVFERSPGSLAAVLREALSEEDGRRRRGNLGRELVERRYQWPGIALELQSLYRSVSHPGRLSSSPGPLSTSCGEGEAGGPG